MNSYTVGITVEVVAGNEQLAIETARAAGMSLRGLEGVAHASIEMEARPLFDDSAFVQVRGQTALETDSEDAKWERIYAKAATHAPTPGNEISNVWD